MVLLKILCLKNWLKIVNAIDTKLPSTSGLLLKQI